MNLLLAWTVIGKFSLSIWGFNCAELKREEVIRRSAEELSLKNDLLRRLVRELVTPGEKKEPLKIYADNKESYF